MTTEKEALAALKPEDHAVLRAAGAGVLHADDRFTGTKNELRYPKNPGEVNAGESVPMRQHRRLREQLGLIDYTTTVEKHGPTRPGQNCGYTTTKMALTPLGVRVVTHLNIDRFLPSRAES